MRSRAVIVVLVLGSAGANAQPVYTPVNDDSIVLRLDGNTGGATHWEEPRQLRKALEHRPDDTRTRESLARWYLEQGQRSGDARLYGHAAAVLEPWRSEPRPPPGIALLRATLKQHEHRFHEALKDLDVAIAARRRNPQAWLARATILENLGRPREALRACAPLHRTAAKAVALACTGSALGLTGQDRRAAALLGRALASTGENDSRLSAWILTRLADSQRRQGQHDLATQSLRNALRLTPGDAFTLTQLADLLLTRGLYREVLALDSQNRPSGALTLRLAIAARALDYPDGLARIASLVATRDSDRRRGGLRHLADEARLALDLQDHPDEALRLALRNWQVQRTPADALILLRAAVAATRSTAAQPVMEWLSRTGYRDPELDLLVARLERPSA